jgi:hypothetical protein
MNGGAGGFASDQNKSSGGVVSEGLRRQQATMSGGTSTLDDDPQDYTRAFQTDEQRVFLWHMANRNLRPRASRPAFRLLGLFATVEEAQAHGARIVATDPNSACTIRVGATHAWYTIPADMFTDITPYLNKVNRNLALHQKVLAATTTEFKTHKSTLTSGRQPTSQSHVEAALERSSTVASVPVSSPVPDADDADADADDADDGGVSESKSVDPPSPQSSVVADTAAGEDEDTGMTMLSRLPPVNTSPEDDDARETWGGCAGVSVAPLARDAEVRNQKYAVVSVLLDYEVLMHREDAAAGLGAGESGALDAVEPGVCVWAAFDTEAEALLYVKKVAARELPDHDLSVVMMYEWLYPHLMTSDKVPQLYRNVELNNIMKHARTSRGRVCDFEKECVTKGVKLPLLEIEPDLDVPSPVCYSSSAPVVEDLDTDLDPSPPVRPVLERQ